MCRCYFFSLEYYYNIRCRVSFLFLIFFLILISSLLFFPLPFKKKEATIMHCPLPPPPPPPFCRYIIMYGSNCRTLDNSDVKENETFFCWGWGIVLVLWHCLTSFTFGCTTLFCIPVHFFIVCFNWLLTKMSILGMWKGGGHSLAGWWKTIWGMEHFHFSQTVQEDCKYMCMYA